MSNIGLKYFVLKPTGRSAWAKASRTAMRVFAVEIEATEPELAGSLKQWAYAEERKINTEEPDENRKTA